VQGVSVPAKPISLFEPWFPPSYADAVRDQVQSGFLGPGRTSQAFTQELAAFSRAAHCLLTVSGTAALTVAAAALELKAGDEILVPAFGVISTINAFASVGLSPRLVDIDRRTGCMSVEKLREAISPRTKAVCFVNFSGYTGDNLVQAAAECERHGIPLIEDAACALGHRHNGRAAGTFGTVAIYSFSVPKIVTTGQGGAVLTGDRAIFERAAAFIDQGDLEWRKTNLNRGIGTNLRFTDIQASFGLCQVRDLGVRLARRRAAFEALRSGLEPWLYCVPGAEAPLHNIVFTPQPDQLIDSLKTNGIQAIRQYRTISQHPAYAHLAGHFPESDYWTSHAVYLPFGMNLTGEDAARIARAVRDSGVPLDRLAI
jgi:perosamine synthetase